MECGVIKGDIKPGSTVAIIGTITPPNTSPTLPSRPSNQLFCRLELTAFLDFSFSEIAEAYRKFENEKATLKVIVDF